MIEINIDSEYIKLEAIVILLFFLQFGKILIENKGDIF